jgi:hypothetical protein
MPQFYCFHCGQHIDAHADLSGWEVDCPACGGSLVVPGGRRPDPAPEPELAMGLVPLPEAPAITEPVPVQKVEEKEEAVPEPPPPVVSAKAEQPSSPPVAISARSEPATQPSISKAPEPAPESAQMAGLAMAFAPPVVVIAPPPVEAITDKPPPKSPSPVSAEAGSTSEAAPPSFASVPEAPVSEAVVAQAAFATISTVPSVPFVAYVVEASAPPPPPVVEETSKPAPEPLVVMPAETVAKNETAPSPPAVSVPEAVPPSEASESTSAPVAAPAPKPHWEPSRKFVPLDKSMEPPPPLTTIPSTVIFMVWMFGGALAQVGLMLGAGQGSVIRDRCQDSLMFMLASSLVILAVVGAGGFFLSMPIAAARKRAVGVFGSSFCIAVLAFGLLVLGSGALWYRSGWPWLAPSLNYVLAPFKDRTPPKAHAAPAKTD